jgi:hypothetical protein
MSSRTVAVQVVIDYTVFSNPDEFSLHSSSMTRLPPHPHQGVSDVILVSPFWFSSLEYGRVFTKKLKNPPPRLDILQPSRCSEVCEGGRFRPPRPVEPDIAHFGKSKSFASTGWVDPVLPEGNTTVTRITDSRDGGDDRDDKLRRRRQLIEVWFARYAFSFS